MLRSIASRSSSWSSVSGADMRPRSHGARDVSRRAVIERIRRGLAGTPLVHSRQRGARGVNSEHRRKGSSMARFRSNKRAKELQRKAKHEAKEARQREARAEGAAARDAET